MSLSNPRVIFGVFSITPYSRTTGLPYGTAEVVGEASMNLSGETVELRGGASKYPWAIEDGAVNAEISTKLKEYPNFLFELFLGKAPTTSGDDTAGVVSTLTNKNGTSVVAATGLASVGIKSGSKTDLKFGKYIVKAETATTVSVYALSRIDFSRGTDKDFEDDNLKIVASNLSIVTDTAVEVPGFGVELTGGSGTIGLTAGDTATFEVKPPSSESMSVIIGGASDVSPEFGMIMYAQQRSDGSMFEIDAFRCKASGAPIKFAEKAFSEADITIKSFFDSEKNGVFQPRYIKAS